VTDAGFNLGESQMGDEDSASSGSSAMSGLVGKIGRATKSIAANAMPRLQEPDPANGRGAISQDNAGGRMLGSMVGNGQSFGGAAKGEMNRTLFGDQGQAGAAQAKSGSDTASFMKPPASGDDLAEAAQDVTATTGPDVGGNPLQGAPPRAGGGMSAGDPRASAEYASQNSSVSASQGAFSASRPGSTLGVGNSDLAPRQASSPMQAPPPGGLLGEPTVSHSATAIMAAGPNPSASSSSVNGQSMQDRQRTAFGQTQ
jgi:hypothetical protein